MGRPPYKRAAQIQEAIRKILQSDWDPLGVGDNSNLKDEYDSFIPLIYRILAGSRSHKELVEFIVKAERELGVPHFSPNDTVERIAQQLLALDMSM